ncbi:MAG: autotransporter-associated beta strand repeat-containing protein [Pseudomonadota bacterium]
MNKIFNHSALFALMGFALTPAAQAASFDLTTGTTTSAQTLGSAAGQTGNIAPAATLSVSGSSVAVTISGNSATLTNLGTLQQTGTGRVIRDNTGVTGLVINNGSTTNSTALMQAADADVIQMNVGKGSVTLNNYGVMNSLNASAGGSQAVDFSAITTGANLINNFAGGVMLATQADAVRPGINGVLFNAGLIKSTTTNGSSSDGVDAQSNSGIQITNTATGIIEGARHGITGGPANNLVSFTTNITNNAGGTIQGDNGSGINFDGFNANQTASIINNGIIIGNGISGDGDGLDVDGIVNLTNTGVIRSINAFSTSTPAQSEGISAGGGTIINSGVIEGLVAAGNFNAVGRGISLLGNDITAGALSGTREAIYANATVTNQAGGLIRGQSDSGIAVNGPASGFTVTINNNAGAMIQGGGAATAAIKTSADNDTINNSGTIKGSSSGKAIDMGAGNNTLTVQGGAASIQGDISGGVGGSNTLHLDVGTGNSFAYVGALSNFANVQVNSGTTHLSGASSYTGSTTVNGGTLLVNNLTGSATGTGNIDVMSGASLGGTGQISGSTTVAAGGTLSPGNDSIGTLALGDTQLNASSTFSVNLDPTNTLGYGSADNLKVTGSVSLDLSNLVLILLSAPTLGQSFTILTNDGSDSITGFFNQGHNVTGTYAGQSWDFYINYLANTDGGLVGNDLQVTAVPVPAAFPLLISALTMLGVFGRRRKV